MTTFCSPLKKQDPYAHALCEELADRGYTLEELDRGVTRLDYTNQKEPKRMSVGKGDRKVSAQEVYQESIDVVEREEDRKVREYIKNIASPPPFESANLQLLKDKGSTIIPWIFDDLNHNTLHDEDLFINCLKKIKEIKQTLHSKGLQENSVDYKKALAIALFDFIRTPKNKGGLGIEYTPIAERPLLNLGETYLAGKANCVEFVNFYYALGRAAGLQVIPIELFRDSKGLPHLHIRVGIRLDPTNPKKMFFLDLGDGLIGERNGEVWGELSRLDLLAYYYDSLSFSQSVQPIPFIEQALRYSPFEYIALNNYAAALWTAGAPPHMVLKIYRKARQINPHYPLTYKGLEKIYRSIGKNRETAWAQKKAETLFGAIK
jgi:hypothetical protein